MIFAGNLLDLEAEYHKSWTGRSRGKARTAYTVGAEGLCLRSDFIRWLARQAHKGGNMVLTKRIEEEGKTILVLEGNDSGKTVEQLVAEVICKLGRDLHPVSSWAIHFASMRHPFSTTQRLRDLAAQFDLYRKANGGPIDLIAYSWNKEEMAYTFQPEFIDFLEREIIAKQEPADVPAR
jgi:hypothetical protein